MKRKFPNSGRRGVVGGRRELWKRSLKGRRHREGKRGGLELLVVGNLLVRKGGLGGEMMIVMMRRRGLDSSGGPEIGYWTTAFLLDSMSM
jgi:hypothetical protein